MYSNISKVSSDTNISKSLLLSKFNEEDIFAYYLGYYPQLGKKYKTPFKEENTPSFVLYVKNNRINYKCFSTGNGGDVFNFVGVYLSIPFNQCLEKIYKDLKGGYNNINYKKQEKTIEQKEREVIINVVSQPFTDIDFSYWAQFNVSASILNKFGVFSCKEVWVDNKLRCKYSNTNPVYAYLINGKWKIYRPYEDKIRKFISNTIKEKCIQGFSQLEYNSDICFITSSLKDVMSLKSIGYESIAMNSENAFIPQKLIVYLLMKYKRVIIFYNNDKAGIDAATKYSELYNIEYIHTPLELIDHKDPSDYIKISGAVNLKQFIQSNIT